MPKKLKGGPFGIFQHPFRCKTPKKDWRGKTLCSKFFFEKSHCAEKTESPLVSPGNVCDPALTKSHDYSRLFSWENFPSKNVVCFHRYHSLPLMWSSFRFELSEHGCCVGDVRLDNVLLSAQVSSFCRDVQEKTAQNMSKAFLAEVFQQQQNTHNSQSQGGGGTGGLLNLQTQATPSSTWWWLITYQITT